jgi:IS5 family transposase
MKQTTFADAEYAGKRKQTRRERFLIEMDRVMPWKGLIALIEPHYPTVTVVVRPIRCRPCCGVI